MKNEDIFNEYWDSWYNYFLIFTIRFMNNNVNKQRTYKKIDQEPADILQDTAVILSLKFNENEFHKKPIEEFRNFTLRVISNKVLSFINKDFSDYQKTIKSAIDTDSLSHDLFNLPEREYMISEDTDFLLSELEKQLSSKELHLLRLLLDGYNLKEIAEITNEKYSTIKSRVSRMRKKNKKILKELRDKGLIGI